MKPIKLFISILVIPLPQFLKRWTYRHLFGYQIHPSAKIGLSWLASEKMSIDEGVVIGNFNRFKNIPFVKIGAYSYVSSWNHFTTNSVFCSEKGRTEKKVNPQLIIGSHVGIAMRHYFDVQDEFSIGDFTTIAGVESQFFTHQIDVKNNCQSAKPIKIGSYCMLGSGCKVSPGTTIPNYSIIALGSILHGNYKESNVLIGGNPAKVIKKLDNNLSYFSRTNGRVF